MLEKAFKRCFDIGPHGKISTLKTERARGATCPRAETCPRAAERAGKGGQHAPGPQPI